MALGSGLTLEQAQRAVGPGWSALVANAYRIVTEREDGRVMRVREKFGQLRIDIEGCIDRELARGWLQGFRQQSLRVCEACGAEGGLWDPERGQSLRDEGLDYDPEKFWIWKTLCTACACRYYVDGEIRLMYTAWLWHYFDIDPKYLQGATRFRGTRVPLDIVPDYIRAGCPVEEFLEGYPSVPQEAARYAWTLSLETLQELIDQGASL